VKEMFGIYRIFKMHVNMEGKENMESITQKFIFITISLFAYLTIVSITRKLIFITFFCLIKYGIDHSEFVH